MIVRTNIFRGVAVHKNGKTYPILEWCFDYDGKKTDLTEVNFPGLLIVPLDARIKETDSSA